MKFFSVIVYVLVFGVNWWWNVLYVVASGSMEPTLHRGDLLFTVPASSVDVGDIVIFKTHHDIVHRVIRKHPKGVLTKGDNNPIDDRFMYKGWLPYNKIKSKIVFSVPLVGYPSLWLSEYRGLITLPS